MSWAGPRLWSREERESYREGRDVHRGHLSAQKRRLAKLRGLALISAGARTAKCVPALNHPEGDRRRCRIERVLTSAEGSIGVERWDFDYARITLRCYAQLENAYNPWMANGDIDITD